MEYDEFLLSKKKVVVESGFDVELSQLLPQSFPFQKHVVKKGLRAGKYAVFSGTGTGKTYMELDWGNQVAIHTERPVLILAPLAVSWQTIEKGFELGINVTPYSERKAGWYDTTGLYISNYEQLGNIECHKFAGIVLDEASILKNEEGAYRNMLMEKFANTPYKTVFTATPSPNDPMEIGNYSEFLDVMPRSEMLAMYFIHDGSDTSKWRLKGHSKKVFWKFVGSWATMFQNPADINFPQEGYDLPELNINEVKIITSRRNNGKLLNDNAVSATTFNAELRLTQNERLEKVSEIANGSTDTFIIWIKQNEEGAILRKLIPDAVEVAGSDSDEVKGKRLLGFAKGEFRVLISKVKICGYGLNLQICHNQIFASPDFSYETTFQAMRRSWRFGQKHAVNIWIVVTDTMENVINVFRKKQRQFDEMQEQMSLVINEHHEPVVKELVQLGIKESEFTLEQGDCVKLIKNVPDESVGFSIFSPPFPSLYVYSYHDADMGNCKSLDQFFVGFDFLVKDLHRIMVSGRNVAVHCMDIPIQKGKEGYIGLRDFSGLIIKSFQEHGFIYHSRVTLWKNPVTEMTRTKALGLLHKQIKKDSSMSRVGIPDYLLIFRKDGDNPYPIIHQDKDPLAPDYLPVNMWQQYASPVWMDINQTHTLNGTEAREEDDERHIAPLQLQTIERAIHLWSNEGDMVYTPFLGIGSEVYTALKMKRRGWGNELKESYFDIAVKNCYDAIKLSKQNKLF